MTHDMAGDYDLAALECASAIEIADAFNFDTELRILKAYRGESSFMGLDREIRGIVFDTPSQLRLRVMVGH